MTKENVQAVARINIHTKRGYVSVFIGVIIAVITWVYFSKHDLEFWDYPIPGSAAKISRIWDMFCYAALVFGVLESGAYVHSLPRAGKIIRHVLYTVIGVFFVAAFQAVFSLGYLGFFADLGAGFMLCCVIAYIAVLTPEKITVNGIDYY